MLKIGIMTKYVCNALATPNNNNNNNNYDGNVIFTTLGNSQRTNKACFVINFYDGIK